MVKLIEVDGLRVELEHKRVRNTNLRIRGDGTLHVSLPLNLPDAAAIDFIRRKRDWIDAHLAKVEARKPMDHFPADGTIFPLWGKMLPLRTVPGTGRPTVTATQDALVLTCRAMDSDRLKQNAIKRFYVTELTAALKRLVPICERETGLHATEWRIKFMKSRWGSCNVKTHAIAINALLAGYPEGCLHGVIIHELSHLRVAAHDKRFYAQMDAAWPQWRTWDPLLKKQFASLRFMTEKQ